MPTVRNVHANIDWQGYKGNRVILPVCVRSPAMQGRNLTASLKVLSERVSQIDFVLIDTLDRYNFDMKIDECRQRGQNWLDQNLSTVKEYVDIQTITYWDDVLGDSSYKERLSLINFLYAGNSEVREMINTNAMYFINARKSREEIFDEHKAFQNSVSYMIEEYAGTAVYGEHLAYLPEAYWGIYVGNPYFFEQYNTGKEKLVLPQTLPISVSRLSAPFAGEPAIKRSA